MSSDRKDLEKIIQELTIENQAFEKSNRELSNGLKNAVEGFNKLLEKEKELKENLKNYKEAVDKLAAPPLQYALFLGHSDALQESDEKKDEYAVLINGRKHVVSAHPKLKLTEKIAAGKLVSGQSVLLNNEGNIVTLGQYPSQGIVGTVETILSDGTIIVQDQLNNKLIPFRGQRLPDSLNVGDEVLLDQGIALLKIHEGDRLRTLEVLKIEKSFEEIGAQDELISELLKIFDDRLKHPEVLHLFDQKMPKGILMYGPPGCGKTTLAKAVMHKLNESLPEIFEEHRKLITVYKGIISGNEASLAEAKTLEQKYKALINAKTPVNLLEQILTGRGINYKNVEAEEARITKVLEGKKKTICLYCDPGEAMKRLWGDGEKFIRDMFSELRMCAKEYGLAAVILDEPETILRTRGSSISCDASDSLVGEFNREMDGMLENSNIIVFLLTNRQDMIDPAVMRPGRVDRKFHVKRPETADEARKVFKVYLNETHEKIIDDEVIAKYGSVKGAVDGIINRALSEIYENNSMKLDVLLEDGSTRHFRDMLSGAIIEGIVKQAIDRAVDRNIKYMIDGKTTPKKLCEEDIAEAIRQVYQEEKAAPRNTDFKEWNKVMGMEQSATSAQHKERDEKRRRGGYS